MVRVRSKRWCFTLNNPTEEESELLRSQGQLLDSGDVSTAILPLTYLIFGKEYGQERTLHLQGYLEVTKKLSLSSVKKLLPRAHLEKAKGSSKQASDYCKKDGDFEEYGMISPGQGKRTDLESIKELIESGVQEEVIADQHFSKWVVYRRSFQAYASMNLPDRSWKTIVVVLWGDTGTGKTRFCHAQSSGRSTWSPGDFKWFDGYKGQDVVIWDDYRGEYPIQQFLKLTDRYPMSVPIKGGFTKWLPKKIYITSNTAPETWYQDVNGRTFEAFLRRLTVVNFIDKPIFE